MCIVYDVLYLYFLPPIPGVIYYLFGVCFGFVMYGRNRCAFITFCQGDTTATPAALTFTSNCRARRAAPHSTILFLTRTYDKPANGFFISHIEVGLIKLNYRLCDGGGMDREVNGATWEERRRRRCKRFAGMGWLTNDKGSNTVD